MKVAVTGCHGQLGRDMAGLLHSSDHTCLAVDLPDIDITSKGSIQNALGKFGPEIIINCAAYTDVDACETEQSAAMAVNADGPRNLARFAESHGAWLLHISTDYVFPGDRPVPQPYTEEDQTGPVSQYGISKLAGETAIAEETSRFTILRTAWLYGDTGHNFLKAVLKRALAAPDEPLQVVNDQFGSPTWTQSLALQIVALLKAPLPGICHATSEGFCSWFEFATAFLREIQMPTEMHPCTTAEFPRPAPRPANSILENSRLKQAGVNTMRPWMDDLKTFVADHGDALMVECSP